MPNGKRTKAARTKAKANAASAASSPPSTAGGSANFAANPGFSFSFPPAKGATPGAAGAAKASTDRPPPLSTPRPNPFAFASGAGNVPSMASTSTSASNGGRKTSGKRNYAVPSSEEESASSEYETDDDEDDERDHREQHDDDVELEDVPEADEDLPPPEKPDSELTLEEAVERAEARKEAGNVLFKKKDYPSATRLYSQAIALCPTNPAYLTNRAASLMSSRSYSAALADCVAASALQSKAPQTKTLLRLAKCQLALGLVLAAQQTLDQLLRMDPGNPQVASERAKAARIANHVANVMRERENKNWSMVLLGVDAAAREVEETPREWRTWKVEALVGKKRYDEAAGQAADLLRANPKQPEALYYRGVCLYLMGNHAQAIAHAQEALRSDPDFTLARTLLRKVKLLDSLKDAGNDAFKGNRLEEAIAKYSEGLEVDKENDAIKATLLSNRATAYLRLGKTTEALSDCEACLTLQPSYFKAIRTRARVHIATENFEAAVRDFKQAYELAPAGSADEAALQREVREAEVKLKKSKMKDHYKTLGISSDASEDQIKKAYRKSSLIHHPDKGGSDEKFKEIGEAYAILSDPARRRKFDSGIDESDPMSGMGSDFGDMGGFPSGFGGHSHGFGGMNMDDMFGGGGGYGGGGRRRQQNPYGF